METVRAVMVSTDEGDALRKAAETCAGRAGLKRRHTVRMGGVERVVIESVSPPHPTFESCLRDRMPIARFAAPLGGAIELRVGP